MISKAKRWAVLGLGWGFLFLGVIGIFLPILQGGLFLFIGLMLLAREWEPAQRWLLRLRRRFPRMAATMDAAERRASVWWQRLTARFGNNKPQPDTAGPPADKGRG